MQASGKFKTPLAKAYGLGPGHHGAGHWLHERISSAALVPLMLWLVWSVVHMAEWDYAHFTAWLAAPVNAVLMILSVIAAFYHAALGVQVITEDYVHHEGIKLVKIVFFRFFFLAAATACLFSILKIAFTG